MKILLLLFILLAGCQSREPELSRLAFAQWSVLFMLGLGLVLAIYNGVSENQSYWNAITTVVIFALFFYILFEAGSFSTIWPPAFPNILETFPDLSSE